LLFITNLVIIVLVVNFDYHKHTKLIKEPHMTTENPEVTNPTLPTEPTENLTPTEPTVTSEPTDQLPNEAITPPTEPQVKVPTTEEFNQQYFKAKQAEREAEALRKQLAEYQAPKATPTTAPDKNKTLEDFDFDDAAYSEYVIDQKVEAKLAAYATKQQEAQKATAAQTAQEALNQSFNTKANEYATQNPSYGEAMANAANVQYSPGLSEAVLNEGPALDHHLLTNPQLVDKLNGLSSYALGKELATVVGNLSKAATTRQTNAPVPPPVSTGGSRTAADASDPALSAEEYYRLEMDRIRKSAKR
jgi:hypothetical protein